MTSPIAGRVSPADLADLKRAKQVGVTMTIDNVADIVRAVAMLTKEQVMIGIPAENAMRDPADGDTINNAQIGYINEFGVPEKNIPPRPHLIPGVQDYLPNGIKRLKAAADAAIEGQAPKVRDQFNAIGLEAVSSVRNLIQNKIDPPLAPRTIEARMARRTKGESRARASGLTAIAKAFPGIMTPLIDFGDYIKHLTYVIRRVK